MANNKSAVWSVYGNWLRLLSPPRGTNEYFQAVDLLRGIAALAVVLFHYRNFFVPPGATGSSIGFETRLPFYYFLWPIYSYGEFAVQLFWMISGFVFLGVYSGRSFGTKQFVVSRFARLYPLHFITLVVVAALQFFRLGMLKNFAIYQDNDAYHFILQLFLASNWGWEHGYSYNAPIWSVSLEVLIYAVFWITLRKLYKFGMVGPLVLCLAFACGSVFNWPGTLFWQCGFYFFLGSLIYIVFDVCRDRAWLFMAAGLAGIGLFSGMLAIRPTITPERLMPILLPSILLMFCAIDVLEVRIPRWAHWIGDNTYGTYLWHVPIQLVILLVLDGLIGSRTIVESPVFWILFIAGVIVIARWSFLRIERPLRHAVRRRWMG